MADFFIKDERLKLVKNFNLTPIKEFNCVINVCQDSGTIFFDTHMTINNLLPNALGTSEIFQQIQIAKLINLKIEIAKGIKDVKSGRVKKMDIHAIKQKARSLHK
jgi:hypothetical protein